MPAMIDIRKILHLSLPGLVIINLFIAGVVIFTHIADPLSYNFFTSALLVLLLFSSLLSLVVYRQFSSRLKQSEGNSIHQQQSLKKLKAQINERELALELSHRDYRELVESVNSIILRWDTNGNIRFMNRYALDFFGYTADEVMGKSVMQTIVPETESFSGRDLALMIKDIAQHPENYIHNENENIRKDGSRVWIVWSNKAIRDKSGKTIEILSVGHDVTKKKKAEERIQYLAHYDGLTELPNRLMFHERLEYALLEAERNRLFVPILYMDLDRFKPINDTLGHLAGDKLLQEVGRRLSSCVRKTDTIARMGGDEFTIILEHVASEEEVMKSARKVAQVIQDTMQDPFQLEKNEVFISTSIGIVSYPIDGTTIDELLRNADTAMYHAKDRGRNKYMFYEQHMNAEAMHKLRLEKELRSAIENTEFEVLYQPSFNIREKRIAGLEALLRWNRPDGEVLAPNDFLFVAEETGLNIPIGHHVLCEAAKQVRYCHDRGFPSVRIAVNVSLRQFKENGLVQYVKQLLDEYNLPSGVLAVEITEGTFLDDPGETTALLQELNKMGIGILIDDFGSGYSSLARLKELPIDTIKIDRSFINGIPDNASDVSIVNAIIAMAHGLGIRVIAKGVETEEQVAHLTQAGCDEAQGFFISEAMPAANCVELLKQHNVFAASSLG